MIYWKLKSRLFIFKIYALLIMLSLLLTISGSLSSNNEHYNSPNYPIVIIIDRTDPIMQYTVAISKQNKIFVKKSTFPIRQNFTQFNLQTNLILQQDVLDWISKFKTKKVVQPGGVHVSMVVIFQFENQSYFFSNRQSKLEEIALNLRNKIDIEEKNIKGKNCQNLPMWITQTPAKAFFEYN